MTTDDTLDDVTAGELLLITFFTWEAPWPILAAVGTRFLVDRLNITWNSKQKKYKNSVF